MSLLVRRVGPHGPAPCLDVTAAWALGVQHEQGELPAFARMHALCIVRVHTRPLHAVALIICVGGVYCCLVRAGAGQLLPGSKFRLWLKQGLLFA